jgi:hypothetical protein
MVQLQQWIRENVEYLFDYALSFMTNTGITEPSPKLHMKDRDGRLAVVSMDFWDKDDEHSKQDYEEFGACIDKLMEAFGAEVALLAFIGDIKGQEVICILSYATNLQTMLHYKPILWRSEFVDFGPVTSLPWRKVEDLEF